MSDAFKVKWEADDGYVGHRQHHFEIDAEDARGQSEDQLRAFFDECLRDDFRDKVHAVSEDEDAFVAWALALPEQEADDE